jgi:hypothetical protein
MVISGCAIFSPAEIDQVTIHHWGRLSQAANVYGSRVSLLMNESALGVPDSLLEKHSTFKEKHRRPRGI